LELRRFDDHEWEFAYPRLTSVAYNRLDEAIDRMHSGRVEPAERIYLDLVQHHPEFLDARHHLAILLDGTGRTQEAFELWRLSVSIGMTAFPLGFEWAQDILPWECLDNRPFLRAYHGLGLAFLKRRNIDGAAESFQNLLKLNPSDNQGARALLIHCHFRKGRPEDVLAVCKRYPFDGMEQVLYGRVLALLQLDRPDEARAALQKAMEFVPLVAEELAKKRHLRPKGMRPGYVTYGGADQAYCYWSEEGRFWRKTEGAIDFVRRAVLV